MVEGDLRTTGPTPKQWLWFGLLASMIMLLAVAAFDSGGIETDGERVQRLSESYACPECAGQSVAESNAGVASTIRQFIRNEVTAGSTDTEIRDRLVIAYGSEVLLTPPSEGFSSLIWILPVIVLVAGSAAVGRTVGRARGGSRDATDADRLLVAEARTKAAVRKQQE
jgi:cytochrome c-type biogenesis protein CcmH